MSKKRYRRRKSSADASGLIILAALFWWSRVGTQQFIAYILIIAVIAITAIILYKRYKDNIRLSSGIDIIDNMSGTEFEKFLQVHFKKQGYKAQLTPASNDYGADLIIEKDGIKTVVQAKRWSKNVGIEAVQQVIGAINHYGASCGMVIVNRDFTQQAINLAHSNNIELWDRKKLIQFFSKNNGREAAEESLDNFHTSEHIHETEENNNICPACGKSLIVRNGKRGRFWGCTGYPVCRFTRNSEQ